MDNSRPNLLEEAFGIGSATKWGRGVLVGDCVETGGAFLLHQFLKLSLHPDSSNVVIFVAFAHPFLTMNAFPQDVNNSVYRLALIKSFPLPYDDNLSLYKTVAREVPSGRSMVSTR
ncbi:hypothetical protein RND71_025038 [Anisodus tanguticus]|uniref:Uncharacterized protein n=1 Tax=Anisodus tanguticus TaxID=243964 RepID=A0AAE1RRI5_9SOLA|nr:hypothetical protein RND71_025038 [Anisodus tanguticus]